MAEVKISIRGASETDLAAMSKLLGDVFSRRDPPAIATKFSAEKIEQIASIFGTKAVNEGLATVAVSTLSDELLGAILAHDFGRPPSQEIEKLDLSSEPLIALLNELEETFAKTHEIVPGTFLHIFMVAVRDDVSGQGIAKQMVQFCLEQAKKAGFHISFTEATNHISQRIFRKVGFHEIHLTSYNEFVFHGQNPFLDIKEQCGCALMEMDLDTVPEHSEPTG